MYKINRKSTSTFKPTLSTRTSLRNITSKNILRKDLKDFKTFTKKHSQQRINSMKKLTKKNIQQLQNLRLLHLMQKKKEIDKINSNTNTNNTNINNNQIYHNSILPKIPEYKGKKTNIENNIQQQSLPKVTQNNNGVTQNFANAIQKLPVRKVQTTQDMAKVFNAIMNNTQMQKLSQPQQNLQKQIQQEKDIKKLTQQQLNTKFVKIMQRIKAQIFDDIHIDYIAIIKAGYNLYKEFSKNNMIKSIMLKSIDRYNRTQFYKLPDDKLKTIVQMIIQQFKISN